ncbi:type II toxin-antitoxin system HicA family toxin [Dyadobacter luticola]|uniref:Type II toxin-antitoxin system HicA family toxin n=1 Tax=Dyadobacter luticola TaxID=1979387 RepID=A0A5R9KST8_9BACT|nr:type II toxin-antitoxin system HicA family toxin [Dyadobacter luticola]TLU99156.1 type II toxin-antitoxin system HicA family toxin [Dyadobacter luticola]
MNAKQLIRLLEENGWEEVRSRGSHKIFKHPGRAETIPVAFHGSKDIPVRTLNKILKMSGLK